MQTANLKNSANALINALNLNVTMDWPEFTEYKNWSDIFEVENHWSFYAEDSVQGMTLVCEDICIDDYESSSEALRDIKHYVLDDMGLAWDNVSHNENYVHAVLGENIVARIEPQNEYEHEAWSVLKMTILSNM